jgi:3-hydroxybutyryl-CoA dehydrogenase
MEDILIESIESYGLSKKDKPNVLFSKVGIIGCGTVGQNIASTISRKGIEVVFIEQTENFVAKAMIGIERELNAQIEHWGMTESEKKIVLSKIKGYTDYDCLSGCDLVIETVFTKTSELVVNIRKGILKNIEKHVSPDTIIATNSATLVITELSSELEYKHRCVSMHFTTNVPDAKIVEVVKGLYTSDIVYENACKFIRMIGKMVIPVEESPGLISVRMFIPIINEACEMLMEGIATKENIDLTMKNGLGMPLGPFEIADRVGLDKLQRWMDNLYSEFGDLKYKASPLIKHLVRANHLGRKTNKGFYDYDEDGKKIIKK